MPRFESHAEVDAYYSGNRQDRSSISRSAAHRDLDRRQAQDRDRAQRQAASDRERAQRQAAAARRSNVQRAGALVNKLPGVLSAALCLILCFTLLLHLTVIMFEGNDMTDYFSGAENRASIDAVSLDNNDDGIADSHFYFFGADIREDGSVKGQYSDISTYIPYVNSLVGDVDTGNPFKAAIKFFWGFVLGQVGHYIVDIGESVTEEAIDWTKVLINFFQRMWGFEDSEDTTTTTTAASASASAPA